MPNYNAIFVLQFLRTFLVDIHIRDDMLNVFPFKDTLTAHSTYFIILIYGDVFILDH